MFVSVNKHFDKLQCCYVNKSNVQPKHFVNGHMKNMNGDYS